MKSLRDLKIGESGIITSVGGNGSLRRHFLDMGLIPGAKITLIKYAPMGDPIEFEVHGYELTLRVADAGHIEVREIEESDRKEVKKLSEQDFLDHPGFGEGGVRYHNAKTEKQMPALSNITEE